MTRSEDTPPAIDGSVCPFWEDGCHAFIPCMVYDGDNFLSGRPLGQMCRKTCQCGAVVKACLTTLEGSG